MTSITRLMIDIYNITDLDFMGYSVTKSNASYHHLIIPKRMHGPETIENGAVLNGRTSHPYLHRIESVDLDAFHDITSEMIDINVKGFLDLQNLKKIREILEYFEREHSGDTTKSGKLLIKESYLRRPKL